MPRKQHEPWFKAEAHAIAAIDIARSTNNWVALSSEIAHLSEARLSRAKAAHNGKRVQLVQSNEEVELANERGRYLVQPPLVARNAALLDNALKSRGISGVVLCREPKTSLGLCPVVALGSGVTVRVQVEEPKNSCKPTCAWFDHAIEELGNHVLERLDQNSSIQRQLDYLLAHFSAIPTYVGGYQTAIDLCNTLENKSV